jgi:hypothetical protein
MTASAVWKMTSRHCNREPFTCSIGRNMENSDIDNLIRSGSIMMTDEIRKCYFLVVLIAPALLDFFRSTCNPLVNQGGTRGAFKCTREGSIAVEAFPNYGQFSQEPRVREPATAGSAHAG